jgi:hypothetical protein
MGEDYDKINNDINHFEQQDVKENITIEKKEDYMIEISDDGKFVATFDTGKITNGFRYSKQFCNLNIY